MNMAEANKIVVDEDTVVSQYNGEDQYAGNLQKWAYRRLDTFPDLLAACKIGLDFAEQSSSCINQDCRVCATRSKNIKIIKDAIAKAEAV